MLLDRQQLTFHSPTAQVLVITCCEDPQLKIKQLKKEHKTYSFFLSAASQKVRNDEGVLHDVGEEKYPEAHVKDVERMLIYSHFIEDYPMIQNRKGIYSHKIQDEMLILNTGFVEGDGMRKRIGIGVFI
jgi:hypothetical protein